MYKENASLNAVDKKEGVFDIVIGNPPYIDSETMVNIGLSKVREYISKNYKYISGNWDIYLPFFEKGLILSKNILCYITPDKWLSKSFGLKFRQQCLLPKMFQILHVGSHIFDSVRVDGIITFFNQKSKDLTALLFDENKNIKKVNEISKNTLTTPFLIDSIFSENLDIINKIENISSLRISDLSICENACATNDAYKLLEYLKNNSNFDKEKYFLLINTGTIDKYFCKWGLKEITYLGKKHLHPIVNRKKFTDNFGKTYVNKTIKPKIIIKGLNLLDACLDQYGIILAGKTTLVICNNDVQLLKYICGIINSKLALFYIKTKYSSSSYCGGITFTKDMLNSLPIPENKYQQKITNLVQQIIEIKKKNHTSDTSKYYNEINNIIYRLYNLSYDEVKIIEPDFLLSKREYESLSKSYT
ncbi:MAG: Eco57I restriction-modification methylase domain-containing protein [Treponema sp.]|nr:Eco57I restriction-modification methylase domain-containing protein [Treponema sp.]